MSQPSSYDLIVVMKGSNMRKLAIAFALTLPLAFSTAASALPGAAPSQAHEAFAVNQDIIVVKGGRGHGGGHGWNRGHRGKHWGHVRSRNTYGWHQGRKVGWRGHHCPPGLWKQGRC
jgi:hypothetical protein